MNRHERERQTRWFPLVRATCSRSTDAGCWVKHRAGCLNAEAKCGDGAALFECLHSRWR